MSQQMSVSDSTRQVSRSNDHSVIDDNDRYN